MASRFFAIGALGILTAVTAVSAVGPSQPMLKRPNPPGNSQLHIAGSRSIQQRQSASASKFDASLAEISRHVSSVRPSHALEDLHALNPAVRFTHPASSAVPLVLIDAVTTGDPQKLKSALVGLGLQRASQYSNDVGGWLPVDQLDAATTLTELHAIRAAIPRTRAGAVTSQGDFAQNSDLVRSQNALTGAGITVGVLSDSYDCYPVYASNGVPAGGNAGYANNGFNTTAAGDMATGDLPSSVNLVSAGNPPTPGEVSCLNYGAPVQLPFGDEGRAIMQIVHDVAPGAGLAFHTAENSQADFAAGIEALAAPVANGGGGANIIIDDVGYFDEPFFQDGLVAQAVNAVFAQGVAYFSSAGNNGTLAYDNNAPTFTTVGTGQNINEHLLNFDTTGATTTTMLPVSIPPLIPGEFIAIVAEWDQPYVTGAPNSGGAQNQIDLCIQGAAGDVVNNLEPNGSLGTATCTGANAKGVDPVQVMFVYNPANACANTAKCNSPATTLNIVVGLVNGGTTPVGRIKVVVEDDGAGSKITQFATNSGTLQGHPSAAGAAAVGAAFFANTPSCGATPMLENFSSAGGDPILFDVTGTRLATPVFRQKPDFVGPDGGNNTFLGFKIAASDDTSTVTGCLNNASFPNFFGTSAAAPHVAGIAALLLQADPSLTPAQIYTVLQQSAAPIGATPTVANPNYAAGYGFVQADVAATKIPATVPAAPTLTLASSSITVGSSTALTWSSANNQGCTASGSWSGAQASTGSQTVTPTAVGTDIYTLLCTNNLGASPAASVTLSVKAAAPAPSSGGGGGGALGVATLLGLLGMCGERVRRSRRSPQRGRAAIIA
jgi:subtilisin family serine protease